MIIQALTTAFKVAVLNGIHHFQTDTFKLALYYDSASLGPDTTAYTTSGEVVGTNYTAGGMALTAIAPTSSGTTAYVDFADATFSNVTLTVRGGLIYNDTASGNPAVAVLDFGLDITRTAEDLVVVMPQADASNAIIRIA